MEFSAQEKSYIWLDSFPLSDVQKRKILTVCDSPIDVVKNFSSLKPLFDEFAESELFEKMQASLKGDSGYFSRLLDGFSANKVTPIPVCSKDYPKEWLSIQDAPIVLYAKGDLRLLETDKFSIVGSRRTAHTALKTGEKLTEELSQKFTILTGVADGGDTAVIEGALKGSKKLICLLAGGFGSIPKGNVALLKMVEQNGLLLAPNAYDTPVRSFSYERRNKLLALLSVGVLVIGAGEKSGALVTAKYAKEYQKPLFAFPYPPLSSVGVGCNALIKQGAKLTESAVDILEYFGLEAQPKRAVELTETEEKAWQYLSEQGEAHLTEIAQTLGVPPYKTSAILSALEMKGLIVKLGANRFSAV